MIDSMLVGKILSDNLLKQVFTTVLKNRSVLYKDIVGTVAPKGASEAPEVSNAVNTLIEADLIKESAASIKDFNSYYITSDGLNTGKMLSMF